MYMKKENMENTSEVFQGNPTEASKGFLGGWGKQITLSLNAVNLSIWSGLTGMNLASGHTETALLYGFAAGCWGVATVLQELSMAAENRSLKDKVNQLKDQGRK